ncbi:MAG: dihydroorotase [Firmicutes bacterium HGW-Firmicutes-1]|jgi:dihydroorotase|nr:MAG: dihydroorotase [Firmicutes bacterium HGW-Firmicutes-1]
MINTLLIKNGTIFTHDKTIYNMDLLIEDDKIAAIEANIIPGDNWPVIDATGLYIIPGLVDMHCDVCEPGYDFKEDYESAGESAINGGFTTITNNPNSDPVIDNKAIVEYVLTKSKKECPVNVYPYGSLTKGCNGNEIAEIGEMQIAGIVAASDGDIPIQNSALMKTILNYCSMFDMPIIIHSEDTTLSNNHGVNDGLISTQLGLIGAPEVAETVALSRNLLLAEAYNIHIHVAHVSTKRSLDLIRSAKRNGIKITAETSPQYFSMDESSLLDFNSFAKVNPPLRTKEDVQAMIKGIGDGTIDVISSDHKPDTIDSKDVEFELASFGISSFETAFSLAYTKLVETKVINMEQLVHKMSYKPAQILGISKGRLCLDSIADLTIFDPNASFLVEARNFKSKANYSPFDGMILKGLIKYTIVGGKKFNANTDTIVFPPADYDTNEFEGNNE